VEKIWDVLTDIFVEILGFVYDATEIASAIDWFDRGGVETALDPFGALIFLFVIIASYYLFRKDENLEGYPEEQAKLVSKRLDRLGIGVVIFLFTWVILLQVIKFLVGED
jgi:hypothetical protein